MLKQLKREIQISCNYLKIVLTLSDLLYLDYHKEEYFVQSSAVHVELELPKSPQYVASTAFIGHFYCNTVI